MASLNNEERVVRDCSTSAVAAFTTVNWQPDLNFSLSEAHRTGSAFHRLTCTESARPWRIRGHFQPISNLELDDDGEALRRSTKNTKDRQRTQLKQQYFCWGVRLSQDRFSGGTLGCPSSLSIEPGLSRLAYVAPLSALLLQEI